MFLNNNSPLAPQDHYSAYDYKKVLINGIIYTDNVENPIGSICRAIDCIIKIANVTTVHLIKRNTCEHKAFWI